MSGIFTNLGRVLTGRLRAPVEHPFTRHDLVLGLICAWLAGMGRYWDHPFATAVQKAGGGSVIYVFLLALLIWLLGLPLRIKQWNYLDLLTYISLTSPLALLYALPVERWVEMDQARTINCWFLVVVATWRVTLYARYLLRRVELPGARCFIMLLLPLTAIVFALAQLNLDHVIFNLMAGINDRGSGAEHAAGLIWMLSMLSTLLFPFLLIGYIVCIFAAWKKTPATANTGDL
jgi:hypothetical protein